MKKLLILALTSAFVAAANADNPNQFGVASTGLSNAEWKQDNQPVERAYNTSGAIGIDEETSSPLVLSPTAGFTAPDPQVKTVVTVEATFTAVSDSLESLTGTDAKTAFTVANVSGTPRYRYWNGSGWAALDDTVTAVTNSAITIKIELDNSTPDKTEAAFKVNDTQIGQTKTISSDTETTLYALAFAGTGSLTSVDATVTPAHVTTATKKYESVSAAFDDNVAVADMTLRKYNGSFGTMPAADDKLYFPASVNGNTARLYSFNKDGDDYQITTAADLFALKDAVANVEAMRSLSYKQTADIDMADSDAFAGVGTYAENPTGGTPFAGTYDGGNYKISNVTMTVRNYGGIFNQVNGGTIKNLTVENISTAATSGEFGYAIVGNAGNGATLENLTAAGAFLSAEKPGTHNMAGIVVRACGGGVSGTLITNCTNNATIYGDYTKLGGICALTQYKVSGGSVTFDGCVNNGTLVSARTSQANTSNPITGIAGVVGYTADATVLKDCVNNGTITVALADQKVGELVGSGGVESNGSLTDAGGNKADATKKMVHTRGVVTGFQYATVDNGVATTVTSLEKDTTYLLEGNVAASGTPVFTLAANGDYIEFNTSLGYTFDGTVAAGTGCFATSSKEGNLTTWSSISGVPVEVPADTTGGRIEIIVAVPASDTALTAATLINTSNRENGDVLKVLNNDGKYYQWTYNGSIWECNNVASTDEQVVVTPEASKVSLSAGQGVWVTYNPAKPLALNGKTVAAAGSTKVSVKSGYNLVAPPPTGASEYSLASVSGTADDKIVIPGKAAPINCVRKDNKWKVYRVSGTETPSGMPAGWGGVATGGEYVDAPSIPGGTGFFFVSKEAKEINL